MKKYTKVYKNISKTQQNIGNALTFKSLNTAKQLQKTRSTIRKTPDTQKPARRVPRARPKKSLSLGTSIWMGSVSKASRLTSRYRS